jgi:hypothetical protein
MKKNKKIQSMLEKLSDGQEAPKLELLSPAINQLRKQKREQERKSDEAFAKSKRGDFWGKIARYKATILAVAVAAVILVFAVGTSIIVPQMLKKPVDSNKLELSSLQVSDSITLSQMELFPTIYHISGQPVFAEYSVLSKDGKAIAVQYKTRRRAKYAIEDITIIAETDKFFIAEYKSFSNHTEFVSGETQYRYERKYQNAECYDEFYLKTDNVRYYVSIISPKNSEPNYYIDNILKKI